jgi:glucan biosynthesis protein C
MYQNRIRRILVPFLLGLVTIVPLTTLVFFSIPVSIEQGSLTLVSSMDQIRQMQAVADGAMPAFMAFLHLWFLYYLMIFYLAVPLLERVSGWLTNPERIDRMNAFFINPWSLIAFSALTMLTLLPFPGAGVAVNDRPFLVNPAALLYYFVFFACGYVFFRFRDILQTFRQHAGLYGVVAFLLFVWYGVTAAMGGAGSVSVAVKFAGAFFAAVSTWCFIYFLTGLFLNRFNVDTPRTRFLAQGSYWIYLLHMPVVLFFGVAMMNLPLPPFITFVLNTLVTSAVCIWAYQWFVRGSWISVLLNGKRFDKDGNVLSTNTVKAAMPQGSST